MDLALVGIFFPLKSLINREDIVCFSLSQNELKISEHASLSNLVLKAVIFSITSGLYLY